MTPEAKVKAAVKKILTAHGAWYAMPLGGMMGRSGIPDFLGCCNGQFIAIETKAGSGKPTALQKLELQRIAGAGGIALVINENNLNDLENVLNAASGKPCRVSREERAGRQSDNPEAERRPYYAGATQ